MISHKPSHAMQGMAISRIGTRRVSFSTLSFRAGRVNLENRLIPMEGDEMDDEHKQFQFDSEGIDCVLHGAISHILSTLSRSLYTLSLYIDCRSWRFFPFPSSFPLLAELSIKCPFSAGVLHKDALIALKTCPRLKKLVLTGFTEFADLPDVFFKINTFGPKITHLCIPLKAFDMQFMLYPPIHSIPTPTIFPRSLERLFLHSPGRLAHPSYPILRSGTKQIVLVERAWENETIEKGVGDGSLVWEGMWLDGIGGEGAGYWVYPHGYSEG